MPPQDSGLPRPRILVADDETVIAMQIGELLEAEGYELAGLARNAPEAVEMARRLRPDLVLMDIVMPLPAGSAADGPIDGIDACATIQSELNIPVVLLTAHGEEAYLRRARSALPSAYLLKPCQNAQIRAAIEVALALSAHTDPAAAFRLREAHHRIKNSFALLHSMLRLQELQLADPDARRALADAGARVLALSRAHEIMTDGALEDGRGAGDHVAQLARTLFDAQAPPPPQSRLRLELDLAHLPLRPAQVIPCGIFLAEAMTNAIKHAFPAGQEGVIRVSLKAGRTEAELTVADNGVGIGAEGLAEAGASYGMQCLKAAAQQLQGELAVDTAPGRGAAFAVRFPVRDADYQSLSA